ncbi:MAG: AsmA family protein [Bacteroidales bacterium]|nr:AsmA family protein [Bacteroidales bacterium]
MKKIVKIIGFTVLAILILLIVIPIFFKDKVLKGVTEVAGQYVDADINIGNLDLSLLSNFPGATVVLDDVSVIGRKEFKGDTLAAFDNFELTMNVMSLFGGKIKVKSVLLNNPKVNIIVTKQGKPNYDISMPDSEDEITPEEEDTTSSQFALALKKLKVNNLHVTYTDSVTDVHALIDHLNFDLRGDLSDKETILSALMDIAKLNVRMGPIIYINDAVVSLKSDLDANMEQMKFTFKENLFRINELGLALDGWIAVPDTNVRMDLKFGAQNTDFLSVLSMIPAEYAKELEGVKTAGKFSFDGGAQGDFNAVSFPRFWVDFVVDNARFQYPDLPKSAENINIDSHIKCPNGNLDSININVKKFHLEMGDNPVDAQIVVQTSAKDISLDGHVDANLDLGIVKDVVPLDNMTIAGLVKAGLAFKGNLSDIENEQYDRFAAEGDITLANFRTEMTDLPPVEIHKAHLIISPQAGNLEYLNMNLGKSDMALDGKIDNIFQYVFADSTLKASFNFKSNLLDVNDIYSYDHSQPEAAPADTEAAPESTTQAPEIPQNIDFALNTNIGKILYDSLVIDNLSGRVALKKGVASLQNLNFDMLGGSTLCNGMYNGADANKPQVDLQLDLNGINIQNAATTFNTVERLAPIAKSTHGTLSAKVAFKSDMDAYLNPIYKTVNGSGRLITKEISIRDSKVFQLIGKASGNSKLTNPTMKSLDLGFKIVDGTVNVDSTGFKISDIEGSFFGKLGLDQTLDMYVGIPVAGTVANDLLGKAIGSEQSSVINVLAKIGGTVTDPKLTGFSTSATDALKQVVDEKIAEVKEQVSEEAKKIIADAKAKADKLVAEAKAQKDKLVKEARAAAAKAKTEAQQVRDQAVKKAQTEAKKLVDKANNAVAKAAAKKAADEAIKKATKEADKALTAANAKADALVTEAEKKGDQLVSTAQKEADKITAEANKKAESVK